jgi:hypothetical protein
MISDLSLLVFKRHEPSPSVIWMCRMHATKLYRVTVLTKFQWLIDWLSHALPRLPIHGTSSSEGIISIHGCLPCLFGRHGISSRIVHVASPRHRSRSPCVACWTRYCLLKAMPVSCTVQCIWPCGHCWSIRTTGSPAQTVLRDWPSFSTLASKQAGQGACIHESDTSEEAYAAGREKYRMYARAVVVIERCFFFYRSKAHPACASCRTAQDILCTVCS